MRFQNLCQPTEDDVRYSSFVDEKWTEPTMSVEQIYAYRRHMRKVYQDADWARKMFPHPEDFSSKNQAGTAKEIGFTDPMVPDAAIPRLTGQNLAVLKRLEKGPATNVELEKSSGSRRINSRTADVRRWLEEHHKKTLVCTPVDAATGIYRYEIVSKQEKASETTNDMDVVDIPSDRRTD